MQVFVNKFCLFRAFYRCHFLHDFLTWGVTFKDKALATKCIFQNYSQLLDICTRLVLKTAEELILSSVLRDITSYFTGAKTQQLLVSVFLGGYCIYQKLACFVLYLKIINKFLKNKVCVLWKNVQGTQKWHWNFSRPSSF